jgi:hypothetical protein
MDKLTEVYKHTNMGMVVLFSKFVASSLQVVVVVMEKANRGAGGGLGARISFHLLVHT